MGVHIEMQCAQKIMPQGSQLLWLSALELEMVGTMMWLSIGFGCCYAVV